MPITLQPFNFASQIQLPPTPQPASNTRSFSPIFAMSKTISFSLNRDYLCDFIESSYYPICIARLS